MTMNEQEQYDNLRRKWVNADDAVLRLSEALRVISEDPDMLTTFSVLCHYNKIQVKKDIQALYKLSVSRRF